MGRKLQIDSSITKDMKAVASDSFSDSIKMIEIEKIKPNADNFFSLTETETLADDIERQGLKHNLVVIPDDDEPDTYILISGHRRLEAIQLLLEQNRMTNKTVPCFIDTPKSKAENVLNLIMLNATTRVMSDKEIMQQYKVLEQTFNDLESSGKKISGRMREKIAEAMQVSPAQVGKMENINHNAIEEVKEAIDNGDISISTANEIAKLDEEQQKELLEKTPPSEITHKEVKQIQNAENKSNAEQVSQKDEDEIGFEDTFEKTLFSDYDSEEYIEEQDTEPERVYDDEETYTQIPSEDEHLNGQLFFEKEIEKSIEFTETEINLLIELLQNSVSEDKEVITEILKKLQQRW